MLTAPPRVTFAHYAAEVQDMVDYGLSLNEVEGVLADAALPEDSKAALWLLAWSDPCRPGGHPRETPIMVSAPQVAAGAQVLRLRRR